MCSKIFTTLTAVLVLLFALSAQSQAPSPAVSTASGTRAQTGNVSPSGKVDTTTGTIAGRYRVSTEQEYSGRFEEARQKAAIGEYNGAIAGFEEVADRAHQLNDSKAEAESSIRLARTIELASGKGSLDDATFARAKLAYDRAIQVGDPGQQALGRNGLASVLLRRGDPAGAVAQLRAIDLEKVDASHRAVYRYNLGLANDKSGNWAEAYSSYVGAIGDKPEYESAAQATFALLQRSSEPRIAEAVKFNSVLLSTGQISSAGGYTKLLLERWAGKPDSQRLLATLLQYYSISPLTLDDLREQEWPYLQHIANSAPELAEPIRDIQVAYFGSFPAIFEHYQALDFFHGWAGGDWQQAAMGQMLKRAGDEFKKNGGFQDSLSRYAAAWALSLDADAALYAASLLHDHRQFIDSNQHLFDQLLNGIIEVKGMDYNKLDWPNILRMHTLLGTIFEQEKHWGSETELRSAIFQWNKAIYAEAQIRQTNPQYPPSPELYMKLANAYQQTSNPKALKLYLSAAQAFADVGNVKEARSALTAASSLKESKAPSVQEQINEISAEIKKEET